MNVSLTMWGLTLGLISALIILDLLTSSRKAHDVSFKEALSWTCFYVSTSVAFGLWVWNYFGSSFIAMRAKVSRTCAAVLSGLDTPLTPSGLT